MDRIKVAAGVFTWEGNERRSNRYGAIHLADSPYDGPIAGTASVFHDVDALESLACKRVRLTVKVIETRLSGHAGDHALKIFPSTPEVGKEIVLGVGILDLAVGYDGTPDILLRPNDGRSVLWIDPRLLYRLHDQTVEVYAEETNAEFSQRPDIVIDSGPCAFDNGDGSFQVKNVSTGEKVKILPHVERLGEGLFSLTMNPGRGKRFDVSKPD